MEKGRLAGTLTRKNRPVETFLAGHDFDGATINEALRWGNYMEAAAQRFRVAQCGTDHRRMTRREADNVWRSITGLVGRSQAGGVVE